MLMEQYNQTKYASPVEEQNYQRKDDCLFLNRYDVTKVDGQM